MDKYTRGGVILSDGTAIWIVDDIRDGLMVGSIGLEYVLRAGRVKANGALLQRSSYPRLFAWVDGNKGTISTTEADWQKDLNRFQFTLGDGSTTFRVPDLRGKWLQAAENIGLLMAGLPNIKGDLALGNNPSVTDGAFLLFSKNVWTLGGGSNSVINQGTFDASRYNPIYGNATTVQPPSTKLIVQIKY